MAINPLQLLPQRLLPSPIAGTRGGARGGAFETLLSSLDQNQDGSANKGEAAAAELLRMEMMQSSLSLFSDNDEQRSSGVQALASLLTQVCGNGAAGVVGGGTALRGVLAQTAQGAPGDVANSAAKTSTKTTKAGANVSLGGDLSLLKELTSTDPNLKTAGDGIEKTAAEYLGIPYRFGGNGPAGIDCSSFVQHVFGEHQIDLPRTAREQIKVGEEVAPGDLQKGDLVFFHTYASYPSHVGIYLGDGKMIHASSAKGHVTISDMNTDYYRSRFVGAKRLA